MLRSFSSFLLLLVGFGVSESFAAEAIRVAKDKMIALHLARPAHHVMIGSAEIADITVERPRLVYLFGKQIGTTHLVILDDRSTPILSASIVVGPDREHTVTVISPQTGKQTGAAEIRYICGERCTAETGKATGGASRPERAGPAPPGPRQE